MSQKIVEDLKDLLRNANLSNYQTNAYTTLLLSNHLTARELSDKSNIPIGRIYEILENLNRRGLIEIQEDSRPKIYRAKSFNLAIQNLISHISNENKRKVSFLVDQAKILESDLYNSNLLVKKEPSRIFWSTTYGFQSIASMYIKNYNELQEELLLNDFLNQNTLKVLPYGKNLFEPIKKAVDRGIRTKILWNFGHDDRPLTEEQIASNLSIFKEVIKKLEDLYGLSTEIPSLEMKFIHKRIPINHDIFDKKRIIFKLQNPSKPSQIYACMNVMDPKLAEKLREKYLNLWLFEASEAKNKKNR